MGDQKINALVSLSNPIKFYIDSFRGLSRDTWILAFVYLINRCGLMVMPFLSLYVIDELGWSKTSAGLVVACYGIGALTGSHIGGWLSDRLGTYRVMLYSLISSAFAFMALVFFKEFYSLCGWMFFTSLLAAAFSPAALMAVSDYSNEQNVTRGISLLRMAINLGIAIGPAVGGFMAKNYSYDWLFILDGMTCLLAGVALVLLLSHRKTSLTKEKEEKPKEASPYKDLPYLSFLFINLINMIAFFQLLFSVPVFFKEVMLLDEVHIGWFFTVNGLLIFIFEMPIIFIIERSKKFFRSMIIGAVMIGLGLMSLTVFSTAWVAVVMYTLLVTFGEVINFPLIATMAVKRAKESNKGVYMGMVSMMFASSNICAPLLGLPIIEMIGYYPYWIAAGSFSMLSAMGLFLLQRTWKST